MTDYTKPLFQRGDIVEDHYANPAIVLEVDSNGQPTSIQQLAGSDRGRITYAPSKAVEITGARAAWAEQRAREL